MQSKKKIRFAGFFIFNIFFLKFSFCLCFSGAVYCGSCISYMFFLVTAIFTFKILNLVVSKIVFPHHRYLVGLGVNIVRHFPLNNPVLQEASITLTELIGVW